jgi:hypothetical protein
MVQFTTGFRTFAECLGHSAKPRKHSAKALPSVTLGKGHLVANIPAKTSLPRAFCRALDKGFAECQCRHSAKKSSRDGVWVVTASLPSAREMALGKDWALCRAPSGWHSVKTRLFAECHVKGTRQSSGHFAECFFYTLGKIFFKKILICFFPTILHRHIIYSHRHII